MAWRQLPHCAALTEFGAYNGDCMWDALLSGEYAAHGTPPLTISELNAITARAIAEHRTTAPNGAATISAIAGAAHDWWGQSALDFIRTGVRPDGSVIPLDPSVWRPMLERYAGAAPIVLMLANGGALPDNERGIHLHGIAILGGDPAAGKYLAANGDSSSGRAGLLSIYTLADLAAAQPCGAWVGPGPSEVAPVWTAEKDANGHVTAAVDAHGHHIGPGLYFALDAHNLLGVNGLCGETYTSGSECFVALENDALGQATKGTDGQWTCVCGAAGGALLLATYNALQDAKKSPPPAPPAPPDPVLEDAYTAVVALATALKAIGG